MVGTTILATIGWSYWAPVPKKMPLESIKTQSFEYVSGLSGAIILTPISMVSWGSTSCGKGIAYGACIGSPLIITN